MNYVVEQSSINDPIKYFEDMCAIPHGSGNEKELSEYLISHAKSLGLWYYRDDLLNVYIKKPGQGSGVNKPPVILQGHIDMVCEKNQDVTHDFTKDPLKLFISDGWLKAQGTTLGADNGTAAAYMLALLADKEISHPPLECLFTTQEETGLFGAAVIEPSYLEGKRMINLDAGPEGRFLVSSAGGCRAGLKKEFSTIPVSGDVIAIKVRGLFGGHSGTEIHKERGNSNKIMSRILMAIANCGINLISVTGGEKDNAIPRECAAVISCSNINKVKEVIKDISEVITKELATSDPSFRVEIEDARADKMMDANTTQEIISLFYLLPNGIDSWSMDIPGLVVSSLNMGVVRSTENTISFQYSIRSSIDSLLENNILKLKTLSQVFGGTLSISGKYPGWAFEPKSAMRELSIQAFKDIYGKEPIIEAVHAGLECGLFIDKIKGLDIVAMGPTNLDAHTPEERLDIASFQRIYVLLKAVLLKMCSEEMRK